MKISYKIKIILLVSQRFDALKIFRTLCLQNRHGQKEVTEFKYEKQKYNRQNQMEEVDCRGDGDLSGGRDDGVRREGR